MNQASHTKSPAIQGSRLSRAKLFVHSRILAGLAMSTQAKPGAFQLTPVKKRLGAASLPGAICLSALLWFGAAPASAVTFDYENGTGATSGWASNTVTQTIGSDVLQAVATGDTLDNAANTGGTVFAGSESCLPSVAMLAQLK
ncbi:MAG: hypothetical protein ACYC2R_15320 [Burkholderiales bacterium]